MLKNFHRQQKTLGQAPHVVVGTLHTRQTMLAMLSSNKLQCHSQHDLSMHINMH